VSSDGGPRGPELVRFLRDQLDESPDRGGAWRVTGPIWLWRAWTHDGAPTRQALHFVTIDGDVAKALREASHRRAAAWGSVYVRATIGATQWRTAVFPSKDADGYVLSVKASVRKAEVIGEGDVVTVNLDP